MPVAAMRARRQVGGVEGRRRPGGDRFLTDREVDEAGHAAGRIEIPDSLLHPPDPKRRAVQVLAGPRLRAVGGAETRGATHPDPPASAATTATTSPRAKR